MNHLNKLARPTLAALCGLLLAGASHAGTYHVVINTSALQGAVAANGPYALDFQLNSGDTLGNNAAVISNFTFGGGAPVGNATTFGGAAGSLAGPVTLSDSSAFNEFFQGFTADGSIAFDLSLSQSVDAGPTPDSFSVAILDGTLANITTNGLGDSLLQADISVTMALTVAQLHLAAGTGAYAGVTVSAVPEPGSDAMLLGGLAFLMLTARRRPCIGG